MSLLVEKIEKMNENIQQYQLARSADSRVDSDPYVQNSFDQDSFQYFQWAGRFHSVPEDFMIPQDTPMALWSYWIYGDLSKKKEQEPVMKN